MDTIWLELYEQLQGSKYMRICKAIEKMVTQRILLGGDQLPPQRDLADFLGVTLGTVTRGYQEAERRMVVAGETGRGTFVRNPDNERYSLHVRHNLPDQKQAPIPFDLNFPMKEGGPDLENMLQKTIGQSDLSELLYYQPAAGMLRHRQAAKKWMASFAVNVDIEEIFITAGGQHAIHTILLMQSFEKGSLAVENLTYPGVINTAGLLGRSLVSVAMDKKGMIPEELDGACKRQKVAGVYLMPSIQNPTTVMMGEGRRREIVEIARRHDLYIIEDEVYAPLQKTHLTPIREYAPERTYYFTGLSKVLAPGLRIGYLVIPKRKERFIAAAMSASIWMAPPLMAELASSWIHDGTVFEVTQKKRELAIRRLSILRNILGSYRLYAQEGGFHAWLKLPEHWQSELFVKEAAIRGVEVLPASGFCPDRQVVSEGVRICFGAPADESFVAEGARILKKVLEERPRPVTPII